MAVFNVKNLCETTRAKLSEAIAKMETFLNERSLQQLNTDKDEAMEEFYKGYLSDIRHLLVFFPKCLTRSLAWLSAVPISTWSMPKRFCMKCIIAA